MRSPNWTSDELKLVLYLYLDKGLEWLSKINDKTKEIIQLSELLRSLDLNFDNKPDNFRSPGSIRMKLANFKALDTRYEKMALSNIGCLDREIWNRYNGKLKFLKDECKKIIKEHNKGRLPNEIGLLFGCYSNKENEYEDKSFMIEWNTYIQTTYKRAKEIRKHAAELDDIKNSQKIINACYEIIKAITDYGYIQDGNKNIKESYKEHAGINQVPVTSNGVKIGIYVRNTIEELVNMNMLSMSDINNFLDVKWSKEVFRLGHSFFKKINVNGDTKKQITDDNGYIRYWTKVYSILGEYYCMCKEWYESNRKYFDKWYDSIKIGKLQIREDNLTSILEYMKEKDEQDICIIKEEMYKHIIEGIDKDFLLEQFIQMGLLAEYRGSKREYVIDDYELLFNMLKNPRKFIIIEEIK